MSTITTKQLVITCADEIKGLLDVHQDDTLADVRNRIHEELDDDLIVTPAFGFHLNGIRVSEKQENKRKAWDLLDEDVSIRAKKVIKTNPEAQAEQPTRTKDSDGKANTCSSSTRTKTDDPEGSMLLFIDNYSQ